MPAALLREYGGDAYGGGPYGGGTPHLPTLHVRCALDVDPLVLGGIATGDNSTLESLGDWEAGDNTTLALNTARSRVYAGNASARMTAVGAGDISMLIFGLSAVVAGRTYLMWAHVRSETAERQARAVLLWKSGTDVFLTAEASALVETRTDGWVRLGVLATAPPGAALLDIAVDVLDCDAGEIHYADTVTVDYVGVDLTPDVLAWSCKLSGRNHELDRTDSGSAEFTLSNEYGWYTPGALTDVDGAAIPSPYLGNIVPRRRVWILAEWLGQLYPVWSGYTRRWVQSIPGSQARASEVQLSCDDGFRWLTGTPVPPPYRSEVLLDGPVSLFPLDESSSALDAGDIVGATPVRLLVSRTGDGGSAFGAGTVLPVLSSGSNTDGGSTSLGLNLQDEDLADMGAVLDLRFAGGMPPQLTLAPWTLEFWFAHKGYTPPVAQIMFRHLVSSDADDILSGFQLELTTSGHLKALTSSETIAENAVALTSGAAHHVVLTYESGGTFGTASLYVDGTLVGALALTVDPFIAGLPNNCQMGGAISTRTTTPSFLLAGRLQHVALYYSRLTEERIADHYQAGAAGFYLETEADRIAAILEMAGWPAEDTRLDRGLTRLAARGWTETNAVALSQDTAAYGGAAVVMDARGAVRELNRHRAANEVPTLAEFRASEGTEPEAGEFSPWIDDSRIENQVEVERIGGGRYIVSNTASRDRFGTIKGDAIPLGAASDSESITHARWRLTRTAEPGVRVDTITFRPDASADGSLWDRILPREFGDRILIDELPATAPSDSMDVLIGRIAHGSDDTAVSWVTSFALEPALIDRMGVCDHPVYGIADTPQCIAGY